MFLENKEMQKVKIHNQVVTPFPLKIKESWKYTTLDTQNKSRHREIQTYL